MRKGFRKNVEQEDDDDVLEEFSYAQPVWHLVLFSILTLGVYELYWYYRTLCDFREEKDPDISPGVTFILMCLPVVNFYVFYKFYEGLREYLLEADVRSSDGVIAKYFNLVSDGDHEQKFEQYAWPAVLSFIWVGFKLIGYFVQTLELLAFFSVIPIAVAQSFLNIYWLKVQPNVPMREGLSWKQKIAIAILSVMWFFGLFGMYYNSTLDINSF